MLFNSIGFLLFFPIVVLIYFVVPKRFRYIWLLVVSYYFYMCWNPKYIVLIAFSTIITFGTGRFIECSKNGYMKKFWLLFCLISNLSILALFKYANFFLSNILALAQHFSIQTMNYRIDLLLPVRDISHLNSVGARKTTTILSNLEKNNTLKQNFYDSYQEKTKSVDKVYGLTLMVDEENEKITLIPATNVNEDRVIYRITNKGDDIDVNYGELTSFQYEEGEDYIIQSYIDENLCNTIRYTINSKKD